MKPHVPKLTIILGTYNRLSMLKKCLNSLLGKIETDHVIIVIDAGSTDGTLEYLKSSKEKLHIITDLKKIGQARSINIVLKTLKSTYVCWISDDNVLQPDVLDTAVRILDDHDDIGMVALKVKDVTGPYTEHAYIGGISPAGILNVNQGVLRLNLMKRVGYFDEKFPDYGMDTDLTTKILLRGYKVVYTKETAIFHYRDYKKYTGVLVQSERNEKLKLSGKIYINKYRSLCDQYRREKLFFFRVMVFFWLMFLWSTELVFSPLFFLLRRTRYAWLIGEIKTRVFPLRRRLLPNNARDWNNILRGQYISLLDLWYNRKNEYYLVQEMKRRENIDTV